MKLVILGATGATGLRLVEQAIANDHSVVAVVRNPDKIPDSLKQSDKLTVVKADVFDANSLVGHFAGADAVLSCLGYPGVMAPFRTMHFYFPSCEAIVDAMKQAKVRRFVAMTSQGTKKVQGDASAVLFEWILKPLVIGRHMTDMARMEDYLATETNSIDYTCVRPPFLTNGGPLPKEVKTKADDQYVPDTTMSIPRCMVAKFMLDCLQTDEYNGKCVAISLSAK